MKLNVLLTIMAILMALAGIGVLLVPTHVLNDLCGTVDGGTLTGRIAYIRLAASTYIGAAVVNWVARNAEASKARDAIILGNIIGWVLGAILGMSAALSGPPTTHVLVMLLVITFLSLLMAVAFIWVSRTSVSIGTGHSQEQ